MITSIDYKSICFTAIDYKLIFVCVPQSHSDGSEGLQSSEQQIGAAETAGYHSEEGWMLNIWSFNCVILDQTFR